MNEIGFRLRINFQKRGRLRYLSHLELVRALERVIRRAQLPYAISKGFNAHMRHAPAPALPVGTAGLDEYFDVWLTEYLNPAEALRRLQNASVKGLDILAVSYANPRAKGLQATHTREVYEIVLDDGGLGAEEVRARLTRLVESGSLTTARQKGGEKIYDLTQMVPRMPKVGEYGDKDGRVCFAPAPAPEAVAPLGSEAAPVSALLLVTMELRATEQGSIRPKVLLYAALGNDFGWNLRSVTRTRLYGEEG
ncbi:MAG: TIGR03936 family radical SAM-associated protein [Coriobacteriales bacterium]|nr:TIGR03936 family radical SAM-associated protein [Coriobacteriales bacterium]